MSRHSHAHPDAPDMDRLLDRADAEKMRRKEAVLLAVGILEIAGLRRCPHSETPTYCGCAAGKCAAVREQQRDATSNREA
jgi:hypothetical protein